MMSIRTSSLTAQLVHRTAASSWTSTLPSSTLAPARSSSVISATTLLAHHQARSKSTLQPAEEKGHPKPVRTYSQLQRNVLALYRKAYRLIRTKPEETQYHFLLFLRHAFKHPTQGGAVSRKDFGAIEHLLRKGERTIDQVFGDPGVRDVHLPRAIIEEETQRQEALAREREREKQEQGRTG